MFRHALQYRTSIIRHSLRDEQAGREAGVKRGDGQGAEDAPSGSVLDFKPRGWLFAEVLDADLFCRPQRGEKPTVDQCIARLSDWSDVIGSIFDPAAESVDGSLSSTTAQPRGNDGQANTESVPEMIGRYQVRARVDAGSFCTVYRAYDPQLEREVAIKIPLRYRDIKPANILIDGNGEPFLADFGLALREPGTGQRRKPSRGRAQ